VPRVKLHSAVTVLPSMLSWLAVPWYLWVVSSSSVRMMPVLLHYRSIFLYVPSVELPIASVVRRSQCVPELDCRWHVKFVHCLHEPPLGDSVCGRSRCGSILAVPTRAGLKGHQVTQVLVGRSVSWTRSHCSTFR